MGPHIRHHLKALVSFLYEKIAYSGYEVYSFLLFELKVVISRFYTVADYDTEVEPTLFIPFFSDESNSKINGSVFCSR